MPKWSTTYDFTYTNQRAPQIAHPRGTMLFPISESNTAPNWWRIIAVLIKAILGELWDFKKLLQISSPNRCAGDTPCMMHSTVLRSVVGGGLGQTEGAREWKPELANEKTLQIWTSKLWYPTLKWLMHAPILKMWYPTLKWLIHAPIF